MKTALTILAGLVSGAVVAVAILAALVFGGPDPFGLQPTPSPSASPIVSPSPSIQPPASPGASPVASPAPSVGPSPSAPGTTPATPSGSVAPALSDAPGASAQSAALSAGDATVASR